MQISSCFSTTTPRSYAHLDRGPARGGSAARGRCRGTNAALSRRLGTARRGGARDPRLRRAPVRRAGPDQADSVRHGGRRTRNWLAVSAACMLVERRKFQSVGGFDESFVVAGGDVELCLRLTRPGTARCAFRCAAQTPRVQEQGGRHRSRRLRALRGELWQVQDRGRPVLQPESHARADGLRTALPRGAEGLRRRGLPRAVPRAAAS